MTLSFEGNPPPTMHGEPYAQTTPRTATELPLRVLYVGNLDRGQTARQRFHAFEDLGCEVTGVHATLRASLPPGRHFLERVRRRLRGPRDWTGANEKILEWMARAPFDVLWIDKGLTINADTLRAVKARQPGCKILGFSPDDMYQRHNQSPQFLRHLPLYDFFFTTKTFGVTELQSIGCPRVAFQQNGYDPDTHRPLTLSDEERARYGGAVGFVGSWESQRASSILRLAEAGVPVRVWGQRWSSECKPHPNLRIEPRELLGLDYARALNSFDINLCFLRKLNRDLQTTRSVEIPACGAFMLAERTDEHLALFREGVEAEFFASDDELLEKTRHYIAHPDERRRIARAGLERCRSGRYSYSERVLDMLTTAGVMRGGTRLDGN